MLHIFYFSNEFIAELLNTRPRLLPMPVDSHSEAGQVIRQLIPLSTMPIKQFESLCKHITIEKAEPNTFLFKKNNTASDFIYLIDGSITLQSGPLQIETIQSGTFSSRFAIAHQIPRKIDAYTNTAVLFLRLSLDAITASPYTYYDVEDIRYMTVNETEVNIDNDDWMTTLLNSPVFSTLPPANLQQLIIALEEISFEKGECIVKQGEHGDFYYIIKKGECLLSRKPSPHAREIKLARLHNQDTFGEDSLLSDSPRNVTVTALSNITLLRLSKDNFISLIKEPSLQFISHHQIEDKLREGAILLDVREPDQYKKKHLPHSMNVPFFSLRMQLKIFNRSKPLIILCEDGKTSQAAAFLLLRNNLDALIITRGMMAYEAENMVADTQALTQPEGTEPLGSEVPESNTRGEGTTEKQPAKDAMALENEQLKTVIKKLTAEKEALTKKNQLLYQQTEKLKAFLDSFKKGRNEDSS